MEPGEFRTAHLSVVGLGLMGGSLALAMRPHADKITGVDPNPSTRAYALETGIVDVATDNLQAGVGEADTVVLAAPVRVIVEMLEKRIGSYLRTNTLLIDIGSTKQDVCQAMGRLPVGIQAVGGHPMTGKASNGIEASDVSIWAGHPFVLAPTRRTTPATMLRALSLVQTLGAVPIEMEAKRHDMIVAAISHLPYLLSAGLVATVAGEAERDPAVWALAAPGFRDTSRLAGSDIKMISGILSTNSQAVARLLALFRMQLAQMEAMLVSDEYQQLEDFLTPVREARNSWAANYEGKHMTTKTATTRLKVQPGQALTGEVNVPGDKSISHRSVMLGALANGVSHVRGWLAAGDTEATLSAIRQLGVKIEREDANTLTIHGGELQAPDAPLDFAHAGTGIRLMAGLMAGQPIPSVLDGSEQLRRRPMGRITRPLRQMGADITAQDGKAPLEIRPAPLKGIRYEMPVASGQVKSCVLLAGLNATGETTVVEPGPSRDHTENMLRSMGADVQTDGNTVTLRPGPTLKPLDLTVPGDASSAAFLLVAACIVPGSEITVKHVNLNPTRTGLIDVLKAMGADIEVTETGTEAGEAVGDIWVRHSELNGTEVSGDTVVRMIDEFPALMVAALRAKGRTTVRDAQEMRVKETDRLAVMTSELSKLGAQIEETPDGFVIEGPQNLSAATVEGHDDHRIAMSLTVAGLVADGVTTVNDAACIGDSFPGFAALLQGMGATIEVVE